MNPPRKHPGATGVAPPLDWRISDKDRIELAGEVHSFKPRWFDEGPFLDEIEDAVRLYLQMKDLAEKSSAGAVKRNLGDALKAATSLQARIEKLDGNSLKLAGWVTRRHPALSLGEPLQSTGAKTVKILELALQFAQKSYPARGGSRPKHERDYLANLVRDALKNHTSARPTASSGGVFSAVLERCFQLAGERAPIDRHSLAERALKTNLITRSSGMVEFELPRK